MTHKSAKTAYLFMVTPASSVPARMRETAVSTPITRNVRFDIYLKNLFFNAFPPETKSRYDASMKHSEQYETITAS